MFLNFLLVNSLVILLGYLFGSINVSIIYSNIKKPKDIRQEGSLNAGATNALRVYGWKAALPIFLFDVLKSFFSVVIAWSIATQFTTSSFHETTLQYIIPQLAGFGAVLGHIWPIFFKFKGGKGAASLAGAILSVNLTLFICGIVLFLFLVFLTRYVSFASIVAPFILCLLAFIPWITAKPLGIFNQQFDTTLFWITGLVLLTTHAFVVYSHKANIKRLLNKTERKLGSKK